jgi:hypothetical protein
MKKKITHISYLEIENGFDIVSYIKNINENPSEIKITANADMISSKSSIKLFRIDSQFVDFEKIKTEFSELKISINNEIGNDYIRVYLFEIF